ncbi:O-antigen ligase [Sinomonas atrocyanea]|uniref:O-antigen ligase family protein n=1 Tax=Sinomonas atrocyanea TaxID=37927 RepID=UPI0027845F33|nr:O-antigen ligase family protein [Sinomonas atrocyanea]MDQ0258615.1 O-antigen ligase [Sinomonas atrocyanea]
MASGYRQRVNSGSLLVAVLFAYAVLPAAAQNILAGRTVSVWTNVETEQSPLAASLTSGLQWGVIGIVALLAIRSLPMVRLGLWFWVFVAPWAVISLATLAVEHRFSYTSILYPLIGLVAGTLKEPRTALRTIGILTALLAGFSIVLGTVMPESGMFPINADNEKSFIGDQLLVGPLTHPNTLGETLAMGFPFISLIRGRPARFVGYGVTLFALFWCGSRTAMLAVGLGIVVALCWMLIRTYGTRAYFSPLVQFTIYSGVVVVGPVLVSSGLDDAYSFSGRGEIWAGSLEQWAEHPWIGNGAQVYSDLAKVANQVGIGAFHGHNMYVNALTTSGILGAAVLTILYGVLLMRSWKLGPYAIGLAVWGIVFIADGWLEVPSDLFTLGTLTWVVWVPLAVMLSGSLMPRREEHALPATVQLDRDALPSHSPIAL